MLMMPKLGAPSGRIWGGVSRAGYLEGLDEGPQQCPDALPAAQQLDQTHDPEEAEEGDGDARVLLRVLGPLTQQLPGGWAGEAARHGPGWGRGERGGGLH